MKDTLTEKPLSEIALSEDEDDIPDVLGPSKKNEDDDLDVEESPYQRETDVVTLNHSNLG